MEKIKLLYLVPHLSTGGMPQFVLKRIESLQKYKDQIEVFLVEYSQFSDTYIVQRDKIINLLGDHFFTLGWFTEPEKKSQLINIIKDNNIDIVHIEEIPEGFESFNKVPTDLLNQLYDNNRTWRIVETCHNVWFDGNKSKKLHPEYYCFVTPYHTKENFRHSPSPKKLLMYPYENKVQPILDELSIFYDDYRVPLVKKITEREKLGIDLMKTHILMVGLWTEGKNQKEIVEMLEEFPNFMENYLSYVNNSINYNLSNVNNSNLNSSNNFEFIIDFVNNSINNITTNITNNSNTNSNTNYNTNYNTKNININNNVDATGYIRSPDLYTATIHNNMAGTTPINVVNSLNLCNNEDKCKENCKINPKK